MYLPQPFTVTDPAVVAELIKQHNFAQLVTQSAEGLLASSLPFLLQTPDPASDSFADLTHWRLQGHLARPNPQVDALMTLAKQDSGENQESGTAQGAALALFQGPHAYISPSAYPDGPAVPTWNYLQVQARGSVQLMTDEEAAEFLENMVNDQEAGLSPAWSLAGQKDRFLQMQRRGILSFELRLTDLQCKAKLNQNKSAAHQAGTLAWLKEQAGDEAQATARWTERLCDL